MLSWWQVCVAVRSAGFRSCLTPPITSWAGVRYASPANGEKTVAPARISCWL
jgi:hypothetical protein